MSDGISTTASQLDATEHYSLRSSHPFLVETEEQKSQLVRSRNIPFELLRQFMDAIGCTQDIESATRIEIDIDFGSTGLVMHRITSLGAIKQTGKE